LPKRASRVLVTGATGQIGSELTLALRKRHGPENVVAAWFGRRPGKDLRHGPNEHLDVNQRQRFLRMVDKYEVDTIYHLAALLSAVGEKYPEKAWQVNMGGLHSVLEIANSRSGMRVFWPSSMAVYGEGVRRTNTPQVAPLLPTTMYGVTKVAGELLCDYYHRRYGLDVRCLRYPGIISSETLPGGGTTDYAVEIFYDAVKSGSYTCFLKSDATLPMMYMPDCTKASIDIMSAPASKVRTRTGYNVVGMSFSPAELVEEIKKHIPGFTCYYKPDFRQQIAESWPTSLDDSEARSDWGWKPRYDLASMAEDMITRLKARLSSRPASSASRPSG
jgi:nucleoside-diphosphate-sugar epimerase